MEDKAKTELIPRLSERKDLEEIEDASRSAWKYIKTKQRLVLVLLVILTICSLISIIVYPYTYLIAVFLPIALCLLFFLLVFRDKFRADFLKQFAKQNGYNFESIGLVSEIFSSTYLNNIRDPRVNNLITGEHKNHAIKFFEFQGSAGSGKSKREFEFSVSKIETENYLPKIFLRRKNLLNLSSPSFDETGMQELRLEGDFNKYFSSYIVKGDQIAALQILAPDTMAKIIDYGKMFNLEFIGNNVFIYADWLIDDKANLNILHTLTKILIDELELVGKISK